MTTFFLVALPLLAALLSMTAGFALGYRQGYKETIARVDWALEHAQAILKNAGPVAALEQKQIYFSAIARGFRTMGKDQ